MKIVFHMTSFLVVAVLSVTAFSAPRPTNAVQEPPRESTAPVSGQDQGVNDQKTSTDNSRGVTPPSKTQITGRRMNLLRKGEAVEFVGNVKMVRGNDFLSADRMVSEERKGTVQAWGNVYMRRDVPDEGYRWEAWGDEGFYDNVASSGTLRAKKKPARVRREPLDRRSEEGRLEMEADRVTFFRSTSPASVHLPVRRSTESVPADETAAADSSTSTATSSRSRTKSSGHAEGHGRVYMQLDESGPPVRETEVWAGHAFYDGIAGSLVFWGGYDGPIAEKGKENRWTPEERAFYSETPELPRARQSEENEVRSLRGEVVTYFVDDKRLAVEHNVKALLFSPEARKE